MGDGEPYLILGGQVHNSSAWPSELPAVWKSFAALHANTVEAPVYCEQVEPQQGKFNWENVDQLVKGAREHNLHVVLLWQEFDLVVCLNALKSEKTREKRSSAPAP